MIMENKMHPEKTDKAIKGIVCDVKNCVYHGACDNCCTASAISVGPSYAESSAETVCATFRPKEI